MKVTVLGTRGFPDVQGGVEKHCQMLYPRLVELGCEVVVFTRKPYVNLERDCFGVKLISLPCPKNKFLETALHTFLGVFAAKKTKPDVLHIHAIGPSLLIPLARLLGLKVVMTNHGPDYKRKKWGRVAKAVLRLGERLGTKFAQNVICISESIAWDIRKKYKRNAAVIPNGVGEARVTKNDTTLKTYGLTKGKYVLSVGRFVPEKGFGDLVEAFEIGRTQRVRHSLGSLPSVASSRPAAAPRNDRLLVIVGDADHPDKYSKDLKERAKRNNSIVLTGFLSGEALQELYSHAGLFVLPSYYEGLPIALLEAMSYGLSCIASDIPANRETGLSENRFFRAGDVEALSGKLAEFIEKPITNFERKEQLDLIARKYDWAGIADRTLNVYKEVVAGRKK